MEDVFWKGFQFYVIIIRSVLLKVVEYALVCIARSIWKHNGVFARYSRVLTAIWKFHVRRLKF